MDGAISVPARENRGDTGSCTGVFAMPDAASSEVANQTSQRPARAAGEHSRLTRWADLPGVELLQADYKRHAYVPHWHDSLTVALVAQGCMRIRVDGSSQLVAPGSVILLDPGRVHDGESHDATSGWDYRVFYLDMQVIENTSTDLKLDHRVSDAWRRSLIQDQVAWGRLLQLHTAISSSQSLLERSSILFHGLADLLTRAVAPCTPAPRLPTTSPGLDRAREYLHANWQEPVSLDRVAAVAGLSRFYFLNSFRKRFGLPPHAYQLQLRIHRAKEMMFQGMPAAEVALKTGFHDQAHLSHTMRRFAGVAPGKIREHQALGVRSTKAGTR